jgi:hypothetical protein
MSTASSVTAQVERRRGAEVDRVASAYFRDNCSNVGNTGGTFVLYGIVLDAATGTPLPGSTVQLRWQAVDAAGEVADGQELALADAAGQYTFCAVPRAASATLQGVALSRLGPERPVDAEDGTLFRRQDVPVYLTRVAGALAGQLSDSGTGEPVDAATVTLPSVGVGVLTDQRGNFRIEDVPPGEIEITIHHVAYGEQSALVEVSPGNTSVVEIRIDPQPIALEPLTVTVTTRPQWLEHAGFYDRQAKSMGTFLTPENIESRASIRFSELLRGIPGLFMRKVCQPHCYYWLSTSTNLRTVYCPPMLWMDGRRMHLEQPTDLDALVSAHDVAAIEFYRGISQTPPQFYGDCGSIVIWTKRGSS